MKRLLAAAFVSALVWAPLVARAADAAEATTETGSRPAGGPDRCLVAAPALRERQVGGGGEALLLVDIRESGAYRQVRIPGSINVPLFAVKTKSLLRRAPFVLVNEGFEIGRLLEECRSLREAGFASVAVLKGGIPAWAAAGGQVAGDASFLARMRSVTPRSFHVERGSEGLIIVDIRREAPQGAPPELPGAWALPFEGNATSFLLRLEAEVARRQGAEPRALLLVDEDGRASRESGTSFEAAAGGKSGPDLFFLEGGLQGYRTFLEEQATILANQGRKNSEGCKTCP